MGETIDRKKLIEDLKDYAEWAEGKEWELKISLNYYKKQEEEKEK